MERLRLWNVGFLVLRVGFAVAVWAGIAAVAVYGHPDPPSPDGRPQDRSYLVVIPAFLGAVTLMAMLTPTSVTLDETGVTLRRLLWPGRRVRWDDLPWVVFTTSRGSLMLVSVVRFRSVSFVRRDGRRFYVGISRRMEDRVVALLSGAGMGERVVRRDPRAGR